MYTVTWCFPPLVSLPSHQVPLPLSVFPPSLLSAPLGPMIPPSFSRHLPKWLRSDSVVRNLCRDTWLTPESKVFLLKSCGLICSAFLKYTFRPLISLGNKNSSRFPCEQALFALQLLYYFIFSQFNLFYTAKIYIEESLIWSWLLILDMKNNLRGLNEWMNQPYHYYKCLTSVGHYFSETD